ncbi:TIGR02117 family protein [Qipengyuania sp. ASV99]|uniref:TIGR02117 family protein n=1 Tax=Qipengyuania sp. ASV99 TaxID=3399681 RepID=UPI003A4C7DB4
MRVKAFRLLRWSGIVFGSAILLFALSGWIGSSLPRNSDWVEPEPGEGRTVEIMVGSNGVHTEIVMPLITPEMDWRTVFPVSDIAARDRPYTHVAVSWGERAFFLETPTWWDLNPLTAIRAMTGGEAVLHIAHYVRPAPSDDYRVLRLRPEEYRMLVETVRAQLVEGERREVLPGYAAHDVFYTVRGTYHIGNTCNQWTSDQLARAGVITAWWTPFPGGVMKWLPDFSGG